MMKKQFFLFALLCSIGAMQAQLFEKVGGSATDIGINPRNGKVFVVSNKNVFTNYNPSSKRWSLFGERLNKAKSVSITRNGLPYMATTNGEVWFYKNGGWNPIIGGIKTYELNSGIDGSIIAMDPLKRPRILKLADWNLAYSAQTRLSQVCRVNASEQYSRDINGYFQKWDARSRSWKKLNGKPNKIAIDHKTRDIYAVGRNKGIYKWNKATNKWILLPKSQKNFVDLAVHDGIIWGVTSNKSIYKCDTRNIITDYAGTYKVIITRRLRGDTPIMPDFFGVAGVRLQNRKGGRLVTINPKDGLPPRFLDISKNNMAKMRKLSRPVYKRDLISNSYRNSFSWSYTINQVREFELSGADANENAEFKFEFNVRENGFNVKEFGKWYAYVLPIADVKFGKEYYSGESGICFKILKI